MEFRQTILNRRSVRQFLSDPVDDVAIEIILKASSLAPTARNVQPWEFVVVRDLLKREAIASLAPNAPFIAQAPVCIAVFCRDTKYYLEDGSAATVQALLAAADLGLGACWVAGDKKDYCAQISKMLNAPDDIRLVSLIAVGKPKTVPHPEKKELKAMIHKEGF